MSETNISAREFGRQLKECADAMDDALGGRIQLHYHDKAFYLLHIVTTVYSFIVQVFYTFERPV